MRLRGYLNISGAALFWGSSATAAKFLFEHSISPLLVVESRVIIAAILLTGGFLLGNRRILRVKFSDLRDLFLLGVIGVVGANYTYYAAIQETSVAIAILMQYTAPAIVAAYMVLSKQEKISRVKIYAISMSLAGCAILLGVFSNDVHITALGFFFGILSAFCFAFFNVFNKIASKNYSVWTALVYTLISAAVFWLLLDVFINAHIRIASSQELVTLTIFSIMSVLIPYYFYFSGLKILLPSTAIVVSTLEPVIAITTAFVILGESLHWTQVIGGFFVIAAVILLEANKE